MTATPSSQPVMGGWVGAMERRERQAEGVRAALVGGWGRKFLHWMSLPL